MNFPDARQHLSKGGSQGFFLILFARIVSYVSGQLGYTGEGQSIYKLYIVWRSLPKPQGVEGPTFAEWLAGLGAEFHEAIDAATGKAATAFTIPSNGKWVSFLIGSNVRQAVQYYLGMEPTASKARKDLAKALKDTTDISLVIGGGEKQAKVA